MGRRAALASGLLILALITVGFGISVGRSADRRTAGALASRNTAFEGVDRELERMEREQHYVEAFSLGADTFGRRLEELGPEHRMTLDTLHRLGWIAREGGHPSARHLIDLAYRERLRLFGPDDPDTIRSLIATGYVRLSTQYGISLLEQAEQRARAVQAEQPVLYADALHALANQYRYRDMKLAASTWADAARFRETIVGHSLQDLAMDWTWAGWTALHAGLHGEAAELLRIADETWQACGFTDHIEYGVVLHALADLALMSSDWPEAERLYSKCARIYERAGEHLIPGHTRPKLVANVYPDLAVAQLAQGNNEQAWDSLQLGRGRQARTAIQMSQWKYRDPDGFAVFQRAGRELASRESLESVTKNADWTAISRRLRLMAEVFSREVAYIESSDHPEATLASLQASLEPDAAFIGWELLATANKHHLKNVRSTYRLIGYVVRRDSFHWVPIDGSNTGNAFTELKREIFDFKHLRNAAASWPVRVEADTRYNAHNLQFGQRLFRPLLPYLDGVDELVVEISGVTPSIPLEALIVEAGVPVNQLFAIRHTPSAAIETFLARDGLPALGIHNILAVASHIDGTAARSPLNADATVRLSELDGGQNSDLRYVAGELSSVAELFDEATVLSGPQASEQALTRLAHSDQLRGFDVIHLSLHTSPHIDPVDRTLLTADGHLDSEEIQLTWALDARLVTLSGCGSAALVNKSRHQILTYVEALLSAGAKGVIVSLWKVDDRATAMLMTRFYRNLLGRGHGRRTERAATPMEPSAALREAREWMRTFVDSNGRRPFEHPVYWSGFILVGV